MTKDEFLQAKDFIFRDIEREIQLARADGGKLQALGVTPGGGNFLAALGLLCYTEFGGKLRFAAKRADGSDVASANFNQFFDLLGADYQTFRAAHNVYDLFRGGLAHEYYVKKSCTIAMLQGTPGPGLRVDAKGHYTLVVESYCRDLKRAFDDLEGHLHAD
jgi:hypothetical protein